MKKVILSLFLALAPCAWPQVISATLTNPGSAYTSAPAVTATGGGCTSEPTLVATIDNNTHVVNGVSPTFAGSGCTSAPSLGFSGGGGSGAAATAVLLPYRIFILSNVNSLTGASVTPTPASNSYVAWQFACYILVPSSRVPFVAAKLFPFPGSAQVTAQVSPPAAIVSALASGIISEYVDSVLVPVSTVTATIEGLLVQACTNAQVNFSAWNPWSFYGTSYNGSTWTVVTIP